MKRLVCALLFGVAALHPALAMDQSLVRQFQKLDPQTRLEQRCDTEAMERINKDDSGFRPDKVIAYSFGEPVYDTNQIKAPGAVFRSKGEWYRLSYKCEATADRLEVNAFKYKIGDQVPHEDWAAHYLYD